MGMAVITGGGTGIGAATAEVLVTQGYDVTIVGRRREVLEATAARLGARAVAADLTRPDEITRVTDALAGHTVDVLVNNAGGFLGGDDNGLAATADWWRRNFDANVLSAVLLTTALRGQLARPGGRVILVSSIAAQRGGAGPYSAAKSALHGWAYDLAADLGPEGITVNVVSPGYIADTEFFGDRMTPERHQRLVGQTLVRRPGEPLDVAAAVRWLASPEAGYVTGQVINVNGGTVLGR